MPDPTQPHACSAGAAHNRTGRDAFIEAFTLAGRADLPVAATIDLAQRIVALIDTAGTPGAAAPSRPALVPDALRRWLAERCVVQPFVASELVWTPTAALYDDYIEWAEARTAFRYSPRLFAHKLSRLLPDHAARTTRGVSGFYGVHLLSDTREHGVVSPWTPAAETADV